MSWIKGKVAEYLTNPITPWRGDEKNQVKQLTPSEYAQFLTLLTRYGMEIRHIEPTTYPLVRDVYAKAKDRFMTLVDKS
jgi:hypothetical protein